VEGEGETDTFATGRGGMKRPLALTCSEIIAEANQRVAANTNPHFTLARRYDFMSKAFLRTGFKKIRS